MLQNTAVRLAVILIQSVKTDPGESVCESLLRVQQRTAG